MYFNKSNNEQKNTDKWKSVKIGDFSDNIHKKTTWTTLEDKTYQNKNIPKTMILSIHLHSFCLNNLFFLEAKRNKIIDGSFSSITYSDSDSILNGIYFKIPTKELIPYIKKGNHSHLCDVSNSFLHIEREQQNFVDEIIKIETDITKYYKSYFKCDKPVTKIMQNTFDSCSIKISNELDTNNNQKLGGKFYIMKISGIWETDSNIGITLKFME